MPTVYVETFPEFVEKHGNYVELQNRILFEDGAQCRLDQDGFQEPPDNEWDRLHLQRRYWQERYKRAEADFKRTRSQLSERCALANVYHNLPHPGEGDIEYLKQLRATAQDCARRLHEVERKLEASPERQRRREVMEDQEKRRLEISKIQTAIHGVTLDDTDVFESPEQVAENMRDSWRQLNAKIDEATVQLANQIQNQRRR